jgi:thymidylate kinase
VANTVKIVSFSGIDGAGKSTQIAALEDWLHAGELRTALFTFWDDVVVLSRFREVASRKAFGGDTGIGTPEQPIHRRDKNVSSFPVTVARFLLYALDAISLRLQIRRAKKNYFDVVIFDRYIYDELANLPLDNWLAKSFVRSIVTLTPRPDAAYLLDADPVQARERKPEYPLEFLHRNRESYLALARLEGRMIVINGSTIAANQEAIQAAFITRAFPKQPALSAASPSLP